MRKEGRKGEGGREGRREWIYRGREVRKGEGGREGGWEREGNRGK